MTQGHGFRSLDVLRLLDGLHLWAFDLESVVSCRNARFSSHHAGMQRALDNASAPRNDWSDSADVTVTAARGSHRVTMAGARMLKMGDRIGSLTPENKRSGAIDGTAINMQPWHDALPRDHANVLQTSRR